MLSLYIFIPAKGAVEKDQEQRFEIATVACGSFVTTLLVHFLLHTF